VCVLSEGFVFFFCEVCRKIRNFSCIEVTMEFFNLSRLVYLYTCEGFPITVLIQEVWSAGLFRVAADIEWLVMDMIRS